MPTPAIAVRCTCRGDAGSSGRGGGADDEVMDQGTKLADLVVVAARVHAVREHDDVHPALEVDPQGRAGEADVADAVARELAARGRVLRRRCVPPERPRRRADWVVAAPELAHDRGGQEEALAVVALAQDGRDAIDVACGREE